MKEAKWEISEEASEYLVRNELIVRMNACFDMVADEISADEFRIVLVESECNSKYIELRVKTDMPRSMFRAKVRDLYRNFRINGFGNVADVMVIRNGVLW